MSKKKITIKPKDYPHYVEEKLDRWVNSDVEATVDDKQLKTKFLETRFTIVIPTLLHRRIKKFCAIKGFSMKDHLTQILEKEFNEF